MRLSLLTLGVAACFAGSVFQVAHADACSDIQSNCSLSPPSELGIPCSKGGDYKILGKNDCCCKSEPAPSDQGNPSPTPTPKPNPKQGNQRPKPKGGRGGRLRRIPPQCRRFRLPIRRRRCVMFYRQRRRQ
ncbi:hypothetical protein LRAMOSA04518 [Lichtheimia ramosa]|uniref:Uncharacterized protein n=1 Tax=Lichtheimia ramosa TaxID=688394 RepID=A0A077WZ80_9FUNG|nr:hypothetical protein LRAMOSA04518 [Lichtheimia ramosa]